MGFKTVFFVPKDQKEKLDKICNDTHKKDDTFIHEWSKEYGKEADSVACLIIYSDNPTRASRRGLWIKKRIKEHFNRVIHYDIRKK